MRAFVIIALVSCGGEVIGRDAGMDASTDDASSGLDVVDIDAPVFFPDANPGCAGGQTWCSNRCTDLTKDPSNCGVCGKKCTSIQYCAMGQCFSACTMPLVVCGMFCVDPSTDHDNCGACGKACAADEDCLMKVCTKKDT